MSTLLLKSCAVIVTIILCLAAVRAARRERLVIAEEHIAAKEPLRGLSARLALLQDEDVVEIRRVVTKMGKTKVKMQQIYKQVKIYGAGVVVESIGGQYTGAISGELVRDVAADIDGNVEPGISTRVALKNCKRINGHAQGNANVRDQNVQLQIFAGTSYGPNVRSKLTYLVDYFMASDANTTRPVCRIDAMTGDILKVWESLSHVFGQPAKQESRGGNLKTGLYTYSASNNPPNALDVMKNRKKCRLQTDNVATYTCGSTTSIPSRPYTYKCKARYINDAINGGHSPMSDAHYFGGKTFEAYWSYLGVPVLNDAVKLFVHYGRNYENAFFIYSSTGPQMYFGDGMVGGWFYPLVSLDVVAHEFSHGFTYEYSGVEYTGESMGVNEAFSDIAGEAVDYFYRGENDYKVGAEIFRDPQGSLRDLCDPTSIGSSIDHFSDYYPGLDGHYSSGIYNKAFCLLAKTSGWDVPMAFKTFARANMMYWTATTGFHSGSCGLESAAADQGYPVADVTSALAAVGVQCPS